jgi:hypothetical protein
MSKNVKNNKIIKIVGKWILMPFALFLLGVILTLIHIINSSSSFTILTQQLNKENYKKITYQRLLAGDKVVGTFKAMDNNLAIIWVRFNSFNNMNSDSISFSLKELDTNKLIYKNIYNTRQFLGLPFFPFGFIPISNSNQKMYEFEIKSLKGIPSDSIALSRISPNLTASYQFPKENIINNKGQLLKFTLKKVVNAAQFSNLLFVMIVYFLPLFFYFFWNLLLNQYINKNIPGILKLLLYISRPVVLILFLISIVDIFYIKSNYDGVFITVSALWISLIKPLKLKPDFFYSIGLVFIILSSILYIFDMITITEKSSIWAFVFLSIGVGLSLYRQIKDKV